MYPSCVEHWVFLLWEREFVFILMASIFALDYLNINNKSKVGVANFYGGLTSIDANFSDINFDFERYIKFLCGENNLIKIYYYNAFVKKKINENAWKKQNELFDRLHRIPRCKVSLCTRKSRLNILGEEYHTIKGDDIFLALDMIED